MKQDISGDIIKRYSEVDLSKVSDKDLLITLTRWMKSNIELLEDEGLSRNLSMMIETQCINVLDTITACYIHAKDDIISTMLDILRFNYVAAQLTLERLGTMPDAGEPTLVNLSVLVAEFNTKLATREAMENGQD